MSVDTFFDMTVKNAKGVEATFAIEFDGNAKNLYESIKRYAAGELNIIEDIVKVVEFIAREGWGLSNMIVTKVSDPYEDIWDIAEARNKENFSKIK